MSSAFGFDTPNERTASYLYRVNTPEGECDVLSLYPSAFEFRLAEESIVGCEA